MDPTQDQILMAMQRYGGRFIKTLAELYYRADPVNQARIRAAFADEWTEYANYARQHAARQREVQP